MKFIDLFAGIGGFHVALRALGHQCVFSSELSEDLRELYFKNFGNVCHGDITKINVSEIPSHDILCAGFPCQTFSKAGNQKGMNEARGKLFDEIFNILSYHKPMYFILENVRNLITHDKGETWKYISKSLESIGYYIDKKILSPHHINIPHHRERVFIIGSLNKNDILNFRWPRKEQYCSSFNDIIIDEFNKNKLEKEKLDVLQIWQRFINELPTDISPYRPLWTMEFGADYPVDVDWHKMKLVYWKQFRGNYGYDLSNCDSIEEVYANLPNYVKRQSGVAPNWKQRFILNNRQFYHTNKKYIKSDLLSAIKNFKQESWKKFEWNSTGENKSFSDKLIQFRGSGIRIKRNDYLPSLVTVTTQIPIIGKYMRYILPQEGAKAQSLPEYIMLPESRKASFRVLGNMVNVEIVSLIASVLLKHDYKPQSEYEGIVLQEYST